MHLLAFVSMIMFVTAVPAEQTNETAYCGGFEYVFLAQARNRSQAIADCATLNATLPVLRSAQDDAAFERVTRGLTNASVPLGLSFNTALFDKSKHANVSQAWLWSDGSVAEFTRWTEGNPDVSTGNIYAYAHPKGQWHDVSDHETPVLCQRKCPIPNLLQA